ncbi:CHAD domain-containing protein [Geomonas sp. RF6]|uniref:CHAD domain-containing protein n=1 Tax=Geomonas sp. RF6 TaxID=2897342 RepID=UPI001E46E267|nr:CHAD domain-containing protein [Geomonas sp. RF6]UFS71748.1 CHAD domain-containing protein [Geomonas sp. RF6]
MNLTGSTPLWVASREMLMGHGEEFFRRLTKAQKSFDAEDIHDLRVASRRLREGIALFSPCFPAGNFAKLEKQVKKVTRLLGTLRNTDEAILFFQSLTPEEMGEGAPLQPELLDALGKEQKVARKKVKRGLKDFPPQPLRDEYHTARDRPIIFEESERDPFMEIREYARDGILARAASVAELVPVAMEEKEGAAQHQLRIAIKRERYRLEIIAPLLHRDYDELHSTLKKYQEVLGKLHDMDVFSEMARDRAEEGERTEALLAAIAARRSGTFRTFREMLEKTPLEHVGERAAAAL